MYEYKYNTQLVNDERLKKDDKVDFIVKAIEDISGFNLKQIRSSSRHDDIVLARHCLVFYLTKHTKHSYITIGRLINRNHASVIHAKNKIDNYLQNDKVTQLLGAEIEIILKTFKPYNVSTKTQIFLEILEKTQLTREQKDEFYVKFLISK